MGSATVGWFRTGLLAAATVFPIAHGIALATNDPQVMIEPGGITYRTQAGDTLSSIALRFTGTIANAAALDKRNQIRKDTGIAIGSAIHIPTNLLLDEPAQARVIAISGAVLAYGTDEKPVPLQAGSVVLEGTRLDTANNSFVTLALPDGARVSMPSNSRIRLTLLRLTRYTHAPRTAVTILRGTVDSNVPSLRENLGRFEVRSRLATAGVRGTHFRVGVLTDGNVKSELLEGELEIRRNTLADNLLLHANQGAVTTTRNKGTPVALLAAPELAQPVITQTGSTAQIALTAVAGAAAYHVQIATDPQADHLFAENTAPRRQLDLHDIPAGDYTVRLSAIDANGLEGATRIVPISLTAATSTARTPSAPFIEALDKQHLKLTWRSPPAAGFQIQIARDAGFTWLLNNAISQRTSLTLPRPPFGTYFARVQMQNSDGSYGTYSPAQAFVVTDQWVILDGLPFTVSQRAR